MRLGATLLAALAVGTTTVSALQAIYIGSIDGCGSDKYGPDWWVRFKDGPACATGIDVGPTSDGLCGKNITVLGHQFIMFTGCSTPYGISTPGPPTGVSDDGVPALSCSPITMPDQGCPSPCGSPNPDVTVKTDYLCS
ncbi:hypothetical protein V8E54_010193 [Elaphomyces granulatus]|jgi:hypothetical protein